MITPLVRRKCSERIHRMLTRPNIKTTPPPPLPEEGIHGKFGAVPHTLTKRGGYPCKKIRPLNPGCHLPPFRHLRNRRDGLLIMVGRLCAGISTTGPPPFSTTPRGVTLENFGSQGMMGANDGWEPRLRDATNMIPPPHATYPRGGPLEKFEPQTGHNFLPGW